MKIFGFEYKTRKELIEENKKLKTENRTMISKVENVSRYENYRVHKFCAELTLPYGRESYVSHENIKEHFCRQLAQEISEEVNYERAIDSLGNTILLASIMVLRKE